MKKGVVCYLDMSPIIHSTSKHFVYDLLNMHNLQFSACSEIIDAKESVASQIQQLMKTLRTLLLFVNLRWKIYFNSTLENRTRWISTYEMLLCYVYIRECVLNNAETIIDARPVANRGVDLFLKTSSDFNEMINNFSGWIQVSNVTLPTLISCISITQAFLTEWVLLLVLYEIRILSIDC